jgi:hypothetical protein
MANQRHRRDRLRLQMDVRPSHRQSATRAIVRRDLVFEEPSQSGGPQFCRVIRSWARASA